MATVYRDTGDREGIRGEVKGGGLLADGIQGTRGVDGGWASEKPAGSGGLRREGRLGGALTLAEPKLDHDLQAGAAPFPPARGSKVTPGFSKLQARLGPASCSPAHSRPCRRCCPSDEHTGAAASSPLESHYGFTGLKITVFLILFSPSKLPLAVVCEAEHS